MRILLLESRIGLEDQQFFTYDITSRQFVIAELLVLIFVTLNLHAGVIYGIESGVNPAFNNDGDVLYYSVVALTTTGFGNNVPVTAAGKIATFVGLIAAVTLIPWLVVRARNRSGIDIECSRCGTSNHIDGSNYCWKCGDEL